MTMDRRTLYNFKRDRKIKKKKKRGGSGPVILLVLVSFCYRHQEWQDEGLSDPRSKLDDFIV